MLSDFIFKSIDVVYKKSQNPMKLIEKYSDGVTKIEDISYSDSICEKYDVYYKEIKKGMPLFFYIHGGGFCAGDKKYRTALSYLYAHESNALIVSINYKMVKEARLHDQIGSVVKAFNHVVANYDVDLNRVIVCGDSSGGYFASYLSILSTDTALQDKLGVKVDAKVKTCITNCGVHNLNLMLMYNIFGLSYEVLVRCTGKERINEYEYYDIMNIDSIVSSSSPFFFVIDSSHDPLCPKQGEVLTKKLDESKIPYKHYRSERSGEGHVFQLSWKTVGSKEVTKEILNIINEESL